MSEWVGVVTRISKQSSQKGDYHILTVGGQDFFLWKPELPVPLNQGDMVKVTYEVRQRTDGKGSNNRASAIEIQNRPSQAQAQRLAGIDDGKSKQFARAAASVAAGFMSQKMTTHKGYQDLCEEIAEWISSAKWLWAVSAGEAPPLMDEPPFPSEEDIPF